MNNRQESYDGYAVEHDDKASSTSAVFEYFIRPDELGEERGRMLHLYLVTEADICMADWLDDSFDELTEEFLRQFDATFNLKDMSEKALARSAQRGANRFTTFVAEHSLCDTRCILAEPWVVDDDGEYSDLDSIKVDVDGMLVLSITHSAVFENEEPPEFFLLCVPVKNEQERQDIRDSLNLVREDIRAAMENITHLDEAVAKEEVDDETDADLFAEERDTIDAIINYALQGRQHILLYPEFVWSMRFSDEEEYDEDEDEVDE